MDNIKKIELIPAGSAFSFMAYKKELMPMDDIYEILKKEEFTADLEKLKPGFSKIEKYSQAIVAIFSLPQKSKIEVLRSGILSVLEVPILETARIIFSAEHIYLSGKTNPGKVAIQALSPFINISSSHIKLSQGRLIDLSEEAVVIKSIQFRKIPHQEVEKITLTGEIESIFDFKGLPLRESEIGSFTGIYNTPFGMRTIKFSQAGKVQIQKSKKSAITLDLIEWLTKKMAD